MPEIKIDPILNVHENYNNVMLVNPYRFSTGANYEPETVNYLAAVGIADDDTVYYSGTPQEKTGNGFYVAVDTYIKSLKTAEVFSKLKAVYPMIGGNASTHKWNLMNPQDTDAAFRMLWFGAGVHSATGFKGNGTDAYGDTRLNQSTILALSNENFGFYARTNLGGSARDMGVRTSQGASSSEIIAELGGGQYLKSQNNTFAIISGSTKGFHTVSRISEANHLSQMNGLVTTTANTSVSLNPVFFYLGCVNSNNIPTSLSSNQYSYAFIGEGLTEPQMTAHYNAVQQLQTDLGRQV